MSAAFLVTFCSTWPRLTALAWRERGRRLRWARRRLRWGVWMSKGGGEGGGGAAGVAGSAPSPAARRARARCPTRFGTPRAPRPCERRWPGPARPACRRTSPAAPRRGCSRSACASAPAPAAVPAACCGVNARAKRAARRGCAAAAPATPRGRMLGEARARPGPGRRKTSGRGVPRAGARGATGGRRVCTAAAAPAGPSTRP